MRENLQSNDPWFDKKKEAATYIQQTLREYSKETDEYWCRTLREARGQHRFLVPVPGSCVNWTSAAAHAAQRLNHQNA